jgi:hypothetical protein
MELAIKQPRGKKVVAVVNAEQMENERLVRNIADLAKVKAQVDVLRRAGEAMKFASRPSQRASIQDLKAR